MVGCSVPARIMAPWSQSAFGRAGKLLPSSATFQYNMQNLFAALDLAEGRHAMLPAKPVR